MKHYSTYQSQFIEMFGDTYMIAETTLSDFINLKAGKSKKSELIQENKDICQYPCYGGNGIRGYVDDYTHNGTFCIIGRQGAQCGNVQIAQGKFYATEHAVVATPLTDINCIWLFYALTQMNLNQYARGVAQPGLAVNQLEKLSFSLPSNEKQNRFGSIAEQADKSKFTSLKSQFIEMFGNYEMNANFGDLFSSARNGANIKQGTISGGIPITRIETISEGEINRDKMGYAGIVDNTYSSYYLQDGDILVSHINSMKHIGKCALYQRINDETIIHGMNLLCLRPYKDIVNPQYVTYLLRSSIMRKLILDITKPAVNQASFTVKDLCKLKVMLPPISEQEEFVAIVDQADKSKYIN